VPLSAPEAWTLRRFSELYYTGPAAGARPFEDTHWMGVPALKCPLDLWVYQELLFRLRPGLIVETGTRHGGTALYLAHLCDLLGGGRVVSIDIEDLPRPQHPRITYLGGSSTDPALVGAVAALREPGAGMFVILDSDHRCAHVLAELEQYGALLRAGDYLIVEDTNVNGHPVAPSHGPGPHEAVEAFLLRHPQFVRDRGCEKFLLTFNPGGFLQRRDGRRGADRSARGSLPGGRAGYPALGGSHARAGTARRNAAGATFQGHAGLPGGHAAAGGRAGDRQPLQGGRRRARSRPPARTAAR
jgi:cephalosporin hydroxylase